MTKGFEKFKAGLSDLGYDPEELKPGWLGISYKVQEGWFQGKELKVAFEVPADFELTPPHGPHMLPRLFPLQPKSKDHKERMHPSQLGADWGHLSRPFPNWKNTKRTVKEYMRWVDHLFNTL